MARTPSYTRGLSHHRSPQPSFGGSQRELQLSYQGFCSEEITRKRLVARWVLDQNGIDGARVLPPDDRVLADLLVKAAMGVDAGPEILDLFVSRS